MNTIPAQSRGIKLFLEAVYLTSDMGFFSLKRDRAGVSESVALEELSAQDIRSKSAFFSNGIIGNNARLEEFSKERWVCYTPSADLQTFPRTQSSVVRANPQVHVSCANYMAVWLPISSCSKGDLIEKDWIEEKVLTRKQDRAKSWVRC